MKPAVKIAIVVALLLVVAVLVYQQSQANASATPADNTAAGGASALEWLSNGRETTASIASAVRAVKIDELKDLLKSKLSN